MNSCLAKSRMKASMHALAATAICLLFCSCDMKKGNSEAAQKKPLPQVSVTTVKTEEAALSAELPGRATPILIAEVRPQVGGIIQKRLFEEGADVKEGDILYQIDPALYKASCAKADAELARAEAAIVSLRKNYERVKKLIESAAVSQKDYDDAESSMMTTQADILACKAAVETERINLEYTKIKAPISGRIGRSEITVGALVTANHLTALAKIQQIDPIYVDVAQANANLLKIRQDIVKGRLTRTGDEDGKVKLILEDGSVYPLLGTLKFRDITVEQSTGSSILRISFPNPEKAILPGMFVRASLELGVDKQAILLPQQAVSRDAKGRAIALVVEPSGKVAQRVLEIDQAIGDKWLVSSGVKPGEQVIVEGGQKVKPGVDAKAVPFAESLSATAKPDSAPAESK